MLIRYGYEITLNCARPTALVCLLSVHDDHATAIRVPERVFTMPIIPTTTYRDPFGNKCLRLVAPTGDLTLLPERQSLRERHALDNFPRFTNWVQFQNRERSATDFEGVDADALRLRNHLELRVADGASM